MLSTRSYEQQSGQEVENEKNIRRTGIFYLLFRLLGVIGEISGRLKKFGKMSRVVNMIAKLFKQLPFTGVKG